MKDNLTNYTGFVIYKGRYGDTFQFEPVETNKYLFNHSNLNYCRYLGTENGLDCDNMGAIDPSGGPYLAKNWFKIDDKLVIRIIVEDKNIYFKVQQ